MAGSGWRALSFTTENLFGARDPHYPSYPRVSETDIRHSVMIACVVLVGCVHVPQILSSVAAAGYIIINYEDPDGREHAFSGVRFTCLVPTLSLQCVPQV